MADKDKNNNGFERAIAAVFPKLALKRAANRERLKLFDGERVRRYDGGRPNRKNAGWVTGTSSSGNTEIKSDLVWLRERARDLVRNNPYAKKAVQVITTNVVGSGIKPSIAKTSGIKDRHVDILMKAWRSWAETTECDFNGQFNIYGLMAQVWKTSVESGDGLMQIIVDPESPTLPFKLKLLEADYLDHQKDGMPGQDGGYIISGVEFNKKGKRVAYWIYPKHPSDMYPISSLMSQRIPAEEVIHLYEVLRPGQVRGIPHGTAAFIRLNNLDEYEDAQLVRQKIAACFSVFIRKNDADFIEQYDAQKKQNDTDGIDLPPLSERMSPGIMEYLQPGEDITFANPPGTTSYEPYTRSNLRAIASAYLITYEALSSDLSNVNFSSYRAGWLEMHRQFSQWQDFNIIGMFCEPIWVNVFLYGLKLKGTYQGADVMAEWTPPRREMIDPLKEAHGMQLLVRAGLTSRADVLRQLGYDPEKVTAEIIAEQDEANKAGLMLESDPKWDATRVNYGVAAYLEGKKGKPDRGGAKPDEKK